MHELGLLHKLPFVWKIHFSAAEVCVEMVVSWNGQNVLGVDTFWAMHCGTIKLMGLVQTLRVEWGDLGWNRLH